MEHSEDVNRKDMEDTKESVDIEKTEDMNMKEFDDLDKNKTEDLYKKELEDLDLEEQDLQTEDLEVQDIFSGKPQESLKSDPVVSDPAESDRSDLFEEPPKTETGEEIGNEGNEEETIQTHIEPNIDLASEEGIKPGEEQNIMDLNLDDDLADIDVNLKDNADAQDVILDSNVLNAPPKDKIENNNEVDLTDLDIGSFATAKAVDDLKVVQEGEKEMLAMISQDEDEEEGEEDEETEVDDTEAAPGTKMQYVGNSDKMKPSRSRIAQKDYAEEIGGASGGNEDLPEEEEREGARGNEEEQPGPKHQHPLSPLEEEEENFMVSGVCTAAEEGNLETLSSLLEDAANFDVTTTNKHGQAAIHIAAGSGHQAVIDFLLTKGANLQQADRVGDTVLHWASRQGQAHIVDFLLQQQDLNIDTQNKNNETALHLAARYGQTTVIERLCRANADVNLQDKSGETPLHIAAWLDLPPAHVALLCKGGKIDTQNQDGESALLCAASRGNLECVRCLLAHQANINLQDKRGCTALHQSVRRRHVGLSLLLLHHGAAMDAVDAANETPLHAACREAGLLPVVQTMCAFGADVEVVSKAGHSPLHIVARSGHIEVARCLLLSGAEPDLPNKDGVTAEIVALAQGNQDVAELLSKLRPEKRDNCIKQLTPVNRPLARIKMKVFGCSGVGKSTLIESLKCGYFSSLFRKSRLTNSSSVGNPAPAATKNGTENGNGSNNGGGAVDASGIARQRSLPTQLSYDVVHENYTKGIDVQQLNISGCGDLSVWEFSGYEPYYFLYDHFIGDPNCLHVIVFRADQPQETQVAEVNFWLHFLKARMAPMEPIGECGRQPWPAKVVLVATHADRLSTEAGDGNKGPEAALAMAKQTFWMDFDVIDHVFVLDAHLAMSPELKALRNQLGQAKSRIVKNLPHSKGFVDAVVAALPAWRKVMGSFPVVTWPSFIEYVRAKVNLLASEEHMKEVMCQLQLLGEVIYVETESEKDLVVLSPIWLCNDVMGELLSHERITNTRPTGCFSMDDFQIMFPETESQDILPLLEALDLCVQCDIDGDIEYEFPCFNFVETLSGLWEREESRRGNGMVYAGVRFVCGAAMRKQLLHMFPRIQVQLRRDVLQDTAAPDSDLYQWYHGSKYCSGAMEALIMLEHSDEVIDVKVRGPADHRAALCFFMEELCEVIEDVLDDSCPGIGVLRNPLSVVQLREHMKDVHAYTRRDVLSAQLNNESALVFSAGQSEELVDLLAFGCQEVMDTWTMGIDLHISHLPMTARRKVSQLLDPTDPMGRDWCMLAVTIGLTEQLPQLDHENSQTLRSRTDRTLERWARRRDATVRALITKLREFGRTDAADVLLDTAACCRFPDKQQQPHTQLSADNTLQSASASSVSR